LLLGRDVSAMPPDRHLPAEQRPADGLHRHHVHGQAGLPAAPVFIINSHLNAADARSLKGSYQF
jgi:hypothetical protein